VLIAAADTLILQDTDPLTFTCATQDPWIQHVTPTKHHKTFKNRI